MPRHHHALPFGAELEPDGQTRFRLWAPDAKSVAVVRPDAQPLALTSQPGGWFEGVAAAGAATRYLYRIDDELNVPDPAARFMPDGLQGFCEVIDPRAFEWVDTQWEGRPWHRAVIYELHVGTFSPQGSFDGVAARLRELADSGINTLELLPLATFPGRHGWGYDGVLPFAPHPAYGRPDDLKRLVDAAHAHGLAVVLDVVYNHFGPQGNYLHRYASPFFTDKYATPWGAAIAFEMEADERVARRTVRDYFIHNALYWLNEYRFDGLRLDAIHAIRDASRPHIVDEIAAAIEQGPGRDRHVHLILENHDNQSQRLRCSGPVSKAQWNDDSHHIAHVLLTRETDGYYANYADAPLERLARMLAEGFAYQGEPFGPQREPRGERSTDLPPTAFIDFLQNHDQIGNRACGERLTVLTDAVRLRAGFSLLLLSPHVPMLFMGEEYGARQPFLYFCDYTGELAAAITNGRRAEFGQFAAFSNEAALASIPDPNDPATFERSRLRWEERTQGDHAIWLDYTSSLLRLRAEQVAPLIPSIEPGAARHEVVDDVVRLIWPAGTQTLHLEANFGGQTRASSFAAGTLIHSSNATAERNDIGPWEVRWWVSQG